MAEIKVSKDVYVATVVAYGSEKNLRLVLELTNSGEADGFALIYPSNEVGGEERRESLTWDDASFLATSHFIYRHPRDDRPREDLRKVMDAVSKGTYIFRAVVTDGHEDYASALASNVEKAVAFLEAEDDDWLYRDVYPMVVL